jgi:hypothetical protein
VDMADAFSSICGKMTSNILNLLRTGMCGQRIGQFERTGCRTQSFDITDGFALTWSAFGVRNRGPPTATCKGPFTSATAPQ